MQKTFPVGYVTREDNRQLMMGNIQTKIGWVPPEIFLKRVEAGLEKPVNEVTTYRRIIPQLCEYVCRFWNETLYTPTVSIEEATPMPTDEELEEMLEKHVYRQSLDN